MRKLGDGTPKNVEDIRNLGIFEVGEPVAPSDWDLWNASFRPTPKQDPSASPEAPFFYSWRQVLPRNGRLVLTDWVVGLVAFIGKETAFALNGGWLGSQRFDARRKRHEQEEAQRKKQTQQAQISSMGAGITAEEYERQTGIKWTSYFSDVPDDGNCLMHAVWLGLKTLLAHYPSLKAHGEPVLPTSAVEFRNQALKQMGSLAPYREAVENQLKLWFSVDGDVLFALEDFCVLPSSLQAELVQINQEVQIGGVPIDQIDMGALVNKYILALNEIQEDSGRKFFLPLGELELEALCQLYSFRLQVVKTEALSLIAQAARARRAVSSEDATYISSYVVPALNAMSGNQSNSDAVREAIKTVLIYVSNCLDSPDEERFRRIRHSNAAFQKRVASAGGAELLVSCGFEPESVDGEKIYHLKHLTPRLHAARFALQDYLSKGDVSMGVDPRSIGAEHIYDRNKEQGGKIVRILNVNTNHYQVHLARSP